MALKKGILSIVSVLTMLILVHAVFAAGPGKMPPPSVTITNIAEQDITPATEYIGHIEAIQQVDLKARIEGILEKINFKEGDFVKKGDILFEIEQAPYRANVNADKARVTQARAESERAKLLLKRLRAAKTESVPATDMDNAIASNLMAKAKLEEARAALEISKINLGYTIIKAPISGRIGLSSYTRGNLLSPSSGTLARIIQMDPIRVVYSISGNDMKEISLAMKDINSRKRRVLSPQIKTGDGTIITGKISFIDNEVDKSTGTIAVRAEFKNKKNTLIPGQYVNVIIKRANPKLMPVVPQSAVLTDKNGYYVMVVDGNNVASPRPIVPGVMLDRVWSVKSGLKVGDKIILHGLQKVRAGQKVNPTLAKSQEK